MTHLLKPNSASNQIKPFLTNQYQKFNLLFLGITIIPLVVVGAINYLIDPYDFFNTPNYLSINHSKPKKDFNDRLYKAADIIRIQPVTVILGSSRTKQALNPEHPAFKNSQPTYNLALNGPNLYEVRRYLEHTIANQNSLKEVILGVDFFMFNNNLENQPSFLETRLEKKSFVIPDLINSLLSIDTLFASQETFQASRKAKRRNNTYGDNGFMPNRNINDGKTKWRFNYSINLFYNLHSDYEFSQSYFTEFRKIVELCRENKIKLIVFISPSHATDLEAIRAIGEWETLENWKRAMTQLTPVWDFSDYNSVTTEKIADRMENYADNSHFTTKVGDWILERIFATHLTKVPSDFGVLLTPTNIEEQIKKTRLEREIWLRQNPDDAHLAIQIKNQSNF